MSNTPTNHGAQYDEFGNITLFEHKQVEPQSEEPVRTRHGEWTLIEDIEAIVQAAVPDIAGGQRKTRSAIIELSHTASIAWEQSLTEGRSQFSYTIRSAAQKAAEGLKALSNLPVRTHRALASAWKFANTPCQTPWKRKSTKPRSRLYLFSSDVVRFGGTFALIFVALFVAINYQSFWQITRAQLALGQDIQTEQQLKSIVKSTTDIGAAGAIVTRQYGTAKERMIDFLPRVGPYQNRLIIPKLGKNVPIVRPSMDALMRQAWKEFEDDVQDALHYGVVHYPGSAVPGQVGNFFITGHSSYYPWDDGGYKDVFARLHELEPGDTYSVYYGGDLHSYRITKKYQVRPSDVSVLDQPTDKRIATLMTCTPTGTTLYRLIVLAEEFDPATGIALKVGEKVAAKQEHKLKLEALPI